MVLKATTSSSNDCAGKVFQTSFAMFLFQTITNKMSLSLRKIILTVLNYTMLSLLPLKMRSLTANLLFLQLCGPALRCDQRL